MGTGIGTTIKKMRYNEVSINMIREQDEGSPALQHSRIYSQIKSVLGSSRNLNIEIITSNIQSKGSLITITPFGLSTSLRGANDGVTYFGYTEGSLNVKLYKY